jgi:hypothetical protein
VTGNGGSDEPGSDARTSSGSDSKPGSEAALAPPTLTDQSTGFGFGSSISTMLQHDTTVGDYELVMVVWNTSDSVTGISDARVTTFTTLAGFTGTQGCQLYGGRVTTATSPDTVMVTFSGSAGDEIIAVDYTGVAMTGSGLDGPTSISFGDGSAATSGTLTTKRDDDTLAALMSASAMPSAGSGYTSEGGSLYSLVEDRVAATPGSYDATAASGAQNASWCLTLAALAGR